MKKTAAALTAAALTLTLSAGSAAAHHDGIDLTPDRWVCKWFPVFC